MHVRRLLFLFLSMLSIGGCYSSFAAQAATPVGQIDRAQWRSFSFPDAGFAVLMPSAPNRIQEAMQMPFGVLDVHTIGTEEEGIAYLVLYSKYPQDLFNEIDSNESLLDELQSGFLTQIGARSLDEFWIESDYWVKEVVYEAKNGVTGRARFYLVEKRIYQVIAATNEENTMFSKNAVRFLDSFKLLDASVEN